MIEPGNGKRDDSEQRFFPRIPGIEALFGLKLFSSETLKAIGRTTEESITSTEDKWNVGFRPRSSVVIEGCPGSGKTAATLALCRSLLPNQADIVYYLSTEIGKERLRKNHSEFDWFNPDCKDRKLPYFTDENFIFADLPPSRMDRPLPSSADLINEIFRGISLKRRKRRGTSLIIVDSLSGLLRDASTPGERRRLTQDFLERLQTEFANDLGLVFLITESPPNPNEETTLEEYIADYVFRLAYKETPGGRRIRTWDVVKSHGTNMETGEHTWELFTRATADSVFFDGKLARYVWNYHWPSTSPEDANDARPATIVFYPQWSTYISKPRVSTAEAESLSEVAPAPLIWSGTPGLDEMLRGDTEYWIRADRWSQTSDTSQWSCGLREGETTLLLGASGTAKTWISIQFLAANLYSTGNFYRFSLRKEAKEAADYRKYLKDRGHKRIRKIDGYYGPTLFVSFEGESSSLKGYRRMSSDLTKLLETFVYVPPASLHRNRLFFELRWLCREYKVQRVVIDGLAELLKSTEAKYRTGVVTALFRAIQNVGDAPDGERLNRPTMFVTYELSSTDDGSLGEFDSVSAICNNVFVLRQIRIHEQMRKAVYILKASSDRPHDRQVREIVMNSRDTGTTPGVRIQSGFEGFTGILTGTPRKSIVVLQLFRENKAEADYNAAMARQLARTFGFHVKLHPFAHAELSQFLDDSKGVLGQVPATDIKVVTLDEWWLGDIQRKPDSPPSTELAPSEQPSPLLRIDGFFALKQATPGKPALFPLQQQRASATTQGLASEHWITEVEKGLSSRLTWKDTSHKPRKPNSDEKDMLDKEVDVQKEVEVDVELQAMPHSADFGMFCLNLRRGEEFLPKPLDRHLLESFLPSLWAIPKGTDDEWWFEPPKTHEQRPSQFDTIADLLYVATKNGTLPENGFSFDMSRGESAVCFLLELAWSFGVKEEFLSEGAINFARSGKSGGDGNKQAEALCSAMRLLQYLVFHGLMPSFPSASTGTTSLLSRQWYSTLNIVSGVHGIEDSLKDDHDQRTEQNDAKGEPSLDGDHNDHQLTPLPFLPVGMLPNDLKTGARRLLLSELIDIATQIDDICSRVILALSWIHDYRAAHIEDSPSSLRDVQKRALKDVGDVKKAVQQLREDDLTNGVRSELIELMTSEKSVSALDVDTAAKIKAALSTIGTKLRNHASEPHSRLSARQLRWDVWNVTNDTPTSRSEKLRFAAAGMAMDIRDVRQLLRWVDERLEHVDKEIKSLSQSNVPRSLHGFSCSGSWMLGVLRNTHSPALSWKLIEELTSRESNRLRAEMGAGIPTRKDFYDFHGSAWVPRLPKEFALKWKDFFDLVGSKVRRRENAVCAKVPLAQFSTILRDQMIRCIDVAARERDAAAPGSDWSQPPDEGALRHMQATVQDAVTQILLYIASEQGKPDSVGSGNSYSRCESCPLALRRDGSPKCGVALDTSTATDKA